MYSFALFMEAAIAISILSASGSIYANSMYSASVANINAMNQYNSVYDLFMAIRHNSTYSACLSNWDDGCIAAQLAMFAAAYKLQYISLYAGNLSAYYGNQSLCTYKTVLCLPVTIKGSFRAVCSVACSD